MPVDARWLPLLALVLTLAAPASAARVQPCGDGRFLLAEGTWLLGDPQGSARQGITFSSRQLAIDGRCEATRAKVKAGRRATVLAARWPACGDRRKVRLVGKLAAPACDVLRGTVRAKRSGAVGFEATRSVCGDGYVDSAAGETCDLPGGGTGSEPTPESLAAARDAIAAGATDVALSPDGTLRLLRIATPTGGIDKVVRGEVVLVQWVHDGDVSEMIADANGDGIPELLVTGRRAPVRSALVRYDLNGDGTVERTVSMTQVGPDGLEADIVDAASGSLAFSTPLFQETAAAGAGLLVSRAGSVVTAEGCTAAQTSYAQSALAAALLGGLQCLSELGLDSIAKTIAGKLARDGVTVRCGGTSSCAQIDILDSVTRGVLPTSVGITLGADFLDGTGVCSNGPMILFHELLHMGLGEMHSPFLDRSTFEGLATDRVYSCTDLCFRPDKATKAECATCLGVDRCDPRCERFADGNDPPCELFVDITGITCPTQSCVCCRMCPGGSRWVSTIQGVVRGPVGTVLRTNLPAPPDGELSCATWSVVTCPDTPGGILQCCQRQPEQPNESTFVGTSRMPPAASPIDCICPTPPPAEGVEFVAQAGPDGLGIVEDTQPDTCP